jgi:hypothetical protein
LRRFFVACNASVIVAHVGRRSMSTHTREGPHDCDWYLVLMGPPRESSHSGRPLPFRIATVHLFAIRKLRATLAASGVGIGIGIATSVREALWEPAELYPNARSPHIVLTVEQRKLLGLFER